MGHRDSPARHGGANRILSADHGIGRPAAERAQVTHAEKWHRLQPVALASQQNTQSAVADCATRPGLIARTVLMLIRTYQVFFSPLNISSCRYQPTCSHYTYEAVERYGARHGAWLGVRRVLRCHPFSASGFDPVPDLDSASHEAHSHDDHSPEAHLRENSAEPRHQEFAS
jgi:uncharacterized protein